MGPQTYTIDASNSVFAINIPLINDNIFEINETFQARLNFPGQPPERVRMDTDSTHATILDDDSKLSIRTI